MPAVPGGADVGEPLAGRIREAERFIEFAAANQSGVRRDGRTEKLEGQSAVEIEPESLAFRFAGQVRHDVSFQVGPIF